MSDPAIPRPARSLPPVPSLEQQKKQARELLDAARSGDADALARIRAHHPRAAAGPALALHDAQLVVAREYGFASWPRLKAHVEATGGAARAARRSRPFVRELSYYDDRAKGLLEVLPDGAAATVEQVRRWHPRFGALPDEAVVEAARGGAFTLDDARLVYARQHGFASWARLADYLTRLAGGRAEADPFMALFEAGKSGDWEGVRSLLGAHPDLARARGTNGNTLLSLACGFAKRRPAGGGDRLAPVRLLLAAGADPNQANDRGWTPLHDAGYGNDPELAALLLSAGARPELEAHGAGGTPLVAALFWGHREAAEVLAGAGVTPPNLRTAAGLGRPGLVRACFGPGGGLTAEARARRAFYRPHGGFPPWRPNEADDQEALDEALVWAAKSGRAEVMPLLVERGARVDADPYRGTPLTWAAYGGRVEAVRWLLDHGADPNRRAGFGGPGHGQGVTALHIAAQMDRLDAARLLVERGADATIRDALHGGAPADWAAHGGAAATEAYLRSAARPA